MNILTTLFVTINISSQASESEIDSYLRQLKKEIKNKLENMPYDSWRKTINPDCAESYPVELNIQVK